MRDGLVAAPAEGGAELFAGFSACWAGLTWGYAGDAVEAGVG